MRPLNLIMVDDDPSILRLIESSISRSRLKDKLNVVAITDSMQAREMLENRPFDILLSDIEMPGLDGIELLTIAKKRNAWTQGIFLTAHSTWERIAVAMERGASDYLTKPLDLGNLLALLAETMQRMERWEHALRKSLHGSERNSRLVVSSH